MIVRKLAVLKKGLLIFLTFCFTLSLAQKDTLPFNRKKEIIYDGKRYRVYNDYLTFGAGEAFSDVRSKDQKCINADFQFHLQKEYFQIGFFMSGDQFLRNTNLQGHLCYGLRREKELYNLAAFIGPSYSYFVTGSTDTSGVFRVRSHESVGGYICLQGVYKVKYDVGLGIELFADLSPEQKIGGVRLILYFSGAYRGEKRGYKSKKK